MAVGFAWTGAIDSVERASPRDNPRRSNRAYFGDMPIALRPCVRPMRRNTRDEKCSSGRRGGRNSISRGRSSAAVVQVAVSRDCRRDAAGGAHRKIVAESLAWASAEHWPIINPRRGEHAADLSRRVP